MTYNPARQVIALVVEAAADIAERFRNDDAGEVVGALLALATDEGLIRQG